MKIIVLGIFYYLFCAFVCYGVYHIVFVLDKSAWWTLLLIMTQCHLKYEYTEKK